MKKRILFIGTYEGNSGASHSLAKLGHELIENEDLDFLAIVPKEGFLTELLRKNNLNYKIIKFYPWVIEKSKYGKKNEKLKWRIKQIINFMSEKKVEKVVREYKPDIIHINAITGNLGLSTALKKDIPVVWHIREFLEEDLNKKFWNNEESLKQVSMANYQIAVSKSVGQKYKGLLPKSNVKVIYNGIDDALFIDRKTSVFSNNIVNLLVLGRIVPEKGQMDAIKAVGKLVNDYDKKNIKLKIVGPISNQTYYDELVKMIDLLNISDHCEFTGVTNKPYDYMKEADISLICSKAEAFGRVTVESIFCGSFVIGKNNGGTSEILSDDVMLYEDDLAEKILYALENKQTTIDLLNNVRPRIYDTFKSSNNSKMVMSVYESIMKG